MPPSPVKLEVQRIARGLEAAVNAGDREAAHGHLSEAFRERDHELDDLLGRTERCELIGTVATRTLLRLELRDDDPRVVELLWHRHHGDWLVEDCRVFSLIPGE